MKFKDVFARWAREVAGKPQPQLTLKEKEEVTQELAEVIGHLDMDANQMQFKDLVIKSKTVNLYDQEVTMRITFTKSGNGGMLLNNLEY